MPGLPRFRVNAFRQRGDISFAFRVIPAQIPDFREPRPAARRREAVRGASRARARHRRHGRGKTTTLAAVVGHINQTRRQHIVTIEDPIEILHSDENCIVNQREVGLDTESFHQALRRALRQDPDVILIGELRDSRDGRDGAAGRRVGPPRALDDAHRRRGRDDQPSTSSSSRRSSSRQVRSILAGVLKGVVSQRLLPRIGGGRVAAVEVMVANSRIQELIRENKAEYIPEAIAEGSFFDMQTMNAALIELVVDGERRAGGRGRRPRRTATTSRSRSTARSKEHASSASRRRAPRREPTRSEPGVRSSPRTSVGVICGGVNVAFAAVVSGRRASRSAAS